MHTVDNTLYTGIVGIALPTLAGVHYTVHSHSFKGENCCTGEILQETKDEHSHGRVSGLAPVMTFHGCSDYVWRNLNNLNASLHSAAAESRCLLCQLST